MFKFGFKMFKFGLKILKNGLIMFKIGLTIFNIGRNYLKLAPEMLKIVSRAWVDGESEFKVVNEMARCFMLYIKQKSFVKYTSTYGFQKNIKLIYINY